MSDKRIKASKKRNAMRKTDKEMRKTDKRNVGAMQGRGLSSSRGGKGSLDDASYTGGRWTGNFGSSPKLKKSYQTSNLGSRVGMSKRTGVKSYPAKGY